MMIVKRSWIFIVYLLWIPLVLILLSGISIYLSLVHIPDSAITLKGIIIIGNVLMTIILVVSSLAYILHFREIYSDTDKIIEDIPAFRSLLEDGDRYFTNFFNWSITNQWLLILIVILEIVYIISNIRHLDEHLFILTIDFIVVFTEIHFIRRYRKRIMDLEMDFNLIVQGKIFFVNQSGLLSDTQTIESDKIKTIKSTFPSKLASFFNYGNIEILAEGDNNHVGSMLMTFVKAPVNTVNSIQALLGEVRSIAPKLRAKAETNDVVRIIGKDNSPITSQPTEETKNTHEEALKMHAIDTREKIRDILR